MRCIAVGTYCRSGGRFGAGVCRVMLGTLHALVRCITIGLGMSETLTFMALEWCAWDSFGLDENVETADGFK